MLLVNLENTDSVIFELLISKIVIALFTASRMTRYSNLLSRSLSEVNTARQ